MAQHTTGGRRQSRRYEAAWRGRPRLFVIAAARWARVTGCTSAAILLFLEVFHGLGRPTCTCRRRSPTRRSSWAQVGPGAFLLLLSPDHTGTAAALMAVFLVLDRAPRRWWVPVLIGLLLAWTGLPPAAHQALADWLAAHRLTTGLGSYAEGNSVTLDSRGARLLTAPGWSPAAWIIRAFGQPAHTYHYRDWTIMTWPGNLLTGIRHT